MQRVQLEVLREEDRRGRPPVIDLLLRTGCISAHMRLSA